MSSLLENHEFAVRRQIIGLRESITPLIATIVELAVKARKQEKTAQEGVLRLDAGYRSYRNSRRVEEGVEELRSIIVRIRELGELIGSKETFERESDFLKSKFELITVNTLEMPELIETLKKFFSPNKDGL